MTDLAKNSKRLQQEKNMTQAELAEILHVTRQTISSWERANSTPDLSLLPAIAEALGTDLTNLLYSTAKPKKEVFRPGFSFVFASVFLYLIAIKLTGPYALYLGPVAFMAICTVLILNAINEK